MSKATTVDFKIWEDRWDAVALLMKQMQTAMESTPQDGLSKTLKALQIFGEQQIDFFLDGFGREGKVYLEPSVLYPPDYVLSATLDQIIHDLNVIGRAWEQRRENSIFQPMRTTLENADLLANKALAPAIEKGILEHATVVTYFQKDTNVRIIPYAPVSFIGLPTTCHTTTRDLLAIPHEVGHYVYRNGRVRTGKFAGSRLDAALLQRYSGQASWRQAWMEEIFADVYGALIGGPVMALGFEDLLSAMPRDYFTYDDGEHPVAALRLGIYQTVFKEIGVSDKVRKALTAQNKALQQEFGKPTTFTTADGVTLDLKQTQKELAKIVRSLLDNELADLPVTRWSGEIDAEDVVDALYKEFAVVAADPATRIATEVAVAPSAAPQMLNQSLSWIDLIKDAVKAQPNVTLPPKVWMALFESSGWATEETSGNAHK
jgi:hypothetical protein